MTKFRITAITACAFALALPAQAQQNNRPDNDFPGPNMESPAGRKPSRDAPEYGPTREGAAETRVPAAGPAREPATTGTIPSNR